MEVGISGTWDTHEKMKSAYGIVAGKHDGKKSLERSTLKWEDNIKMDLEKIGCEGVDWI
jgi:hypothetical protein